MTPGDCEAVRVGRPNSGPQLAAVRTRRRWHFADSTLDEGAFELLINGVETELERKPLEVLIYLLQHAGEVCTKDELLSSVWPGRILSETVLTKCISRLREVLGDQEQEIIKTAYGFGYRLVAPVRVELTVPPEPGRFDYGPGDHPPGRPLWSLVERLGIGGHGEAWRARHEKTHEQRVFKFALDENSLGALKREITLFRVINDTLGESARVVRLLDWNLEQSPYFVEAQYIAGGSLADWVKARGGIAAIALPERLRIVARIASALAAVHSVGVLHKDLKPSNILVDQQGEQAVDILLADFGSGGVLDIGDIERLGITRMGFTKTVAAAEATSATPMYLAPEILVGQPFTVKSDIYALGVILYQFVVGDFHKVMSPGWERGIDDELIREDIALLAEGNPLMRLADAEVLARRLGLLEERRRQLMAERQAKAESERSLRQKERARARRFGLALAFAVLVVGLVASTALYVKARSAQEKTQIAASRSKAVVEFLGRDVFAPISSSNEPAKDINVITLLTRAGEEIDKRFDGQPDIASELHFVLGRSFQSLFEAPLAVIHLKKAMELGEHLEGEGSESALRSASELIQMDYTMGNLRASMPRYSMALAAGEKRFPPDAPVVLELKLRLARGHYLLGDWVQSAQAFSDLLAGVTGAAGVPADFLGRAQFYYGQVLSDLARSTDARAHLESAVNLLSASLGERHVLVAESRAALGKLLADSGRYADASVELAKADELATAWAPPDTWTAIRPRFYKAMLLLHQDEPARAEPILAEIVQFEDEHEAEYLQSHKDSPPELDHSGPVRQALGEAYEREGRLADAIASLKRAVDVSEIADGPGHPTTLIARLSLAECLLMAGGRDQEAKQLLDSVPEPVLEPLGPIHPILAEWHRTTGLLAQRESRPIAARESLGNALKMYQALYGESHWRSVRARQELLAVSH